MDTISEKNEIVSDIIPNTYTNILNDNAAFSNVSTISLKSKSNAPSFLRYYLIPFERKSLLSYVIFYPNFTNIDDFGILFVKLYVNIKSSNFY